MRVGIVGVEKGVENSDRGIDGAIPRRTVRNPMDIAILS
jgi:hypothetical protein